MQLSGSDKENGTQTCDSLFTREDNCPTSDWSSARVSVAVAAVVEEGVRESEGGRKKHVTHHSPETH